MRRRSVKKGPYYHSRGRRVARMRRKWIAVGPYHQSRGRRAVGITQTRGKPADPQIYLEATYIQDPGLEAQMVKFDFLNSYLDRGGNIKRLKNASTCNMSSCCLSRHKQEAVIINATIADICLQLARKLKPASNCIKISYCLSCWRPVSCQQC